jgi:hypothetical protein
MTIALACAFYLGGTGGLSWSSTTILVTALLLRLLFLFSPPQLSDDIYRYLWDGSNLLQGVNPYASSPSAVKPSPEMAIVHSRINHPDYVTIYPPAAQVVFAGGAVLGGTITGLKTFLVLIDMGLCALLILLLKRLEMPTWQAVLYAWNPLPVLEIAGSGHVDGAGMAMVVAALSLLAIRQLPAPKQTSPRWPFLLAGALMACAGLVKLFPFVLAPVLLLLIPTGRRRYFAAGFLSALAALLLPFMPHLVNMAASLDAYARNWEFAGFAFTTLRTLTGSGTIARLLLSGSFLLILSVIIYLLAGHLNRTEAPVARIRHALNASYAIAMAFLLLTPTLQPWYALCMAAFLPFCAGPAGLILCWAVFLTYQVQIPYFILGKWLEDPLVTAAVFLAPAAAWLLAKLAGRWHIVRAGSQRADIIEEA